MRVILCPLKLIIKDWGMYFVNLTSSFPFSINVFSMYLIKSHWGEKLLKKKRKMILQHREIEKFCSRPETTVWPWAVVIRAGRTNILTSSV